jgi:hypothetical protein
MKKRLSILFLALALLAFTVVPLLGQDLPHPGNAIIITAESAPVYAYPDASGVAINILYQGSVDRMGLPGGADWAYLADQGGYVRLDESGLATRTDVLQQKLLKAVTSEIEQGQGTVDAYIRRGTIQMYMQHNY